jgi:DNA polymerase-3 subunit delta
VSEQQIEAISRAWPDGLRLLLLHGYDPGTSMERAARLCRGLVDPANPAGLERLTGEQILADPQALVAAATAVSMFGDRTLIRVDEVDDRAAPALELLLAAPAGNPVIALAGGLKKTSALLKLAGLAGVLAIESRQAGPRELVEDGARLGLKMGREAAAALFEACAGERTLLARELEKFALYLDASPEHPKPLDVEAVLALGAGIDPFDQNGLLGALLAGRSGEAVAMLDAMPDGLSVPVLRNLAGRLMSLLELARRVEGGMRPDAAVEAARPPVFWKEKPLWVAALRRMDSGVISAALADVLAAERAIKAPASLGDPHGRALLLRLAEPLQG